MIAMSSRGRRLDAEWKALRAASHHWGRRLRAFAQRRAEQQRPGMPPSEMASHEEMRRGKWRMNYERDEDGRLV